MRLFETFYFSKLEDIYLDEKTYNSIGGREFYFKHYLDEFPEVGKHQYEKWESLDNEIKSQYIYTLIKEIVNKEDTLSSYMLLMAILYVRYNDIDKIQEMASKSTYYYPLINEQSADKKYRLILIKKLHDSSIEWYMPESKILHINPYFHTRDYYKSKIDEIFDNKAVEITLKKTSYFPTLGDRLAFLLFFDDMLNNGYTREDISLSTSLNLKQLSREKHTLDELIRQVKL